MQNPEKELISIIRNAGVDFICSLPCEKIKDLLRIIEKTFPHIPLTREEEGVGICAGAAFAGKRPAMFIQSSGVGNMINALLSLTGFYELPLAVFVSLRGIYKENIAAQIPMGKHLPDILKGAGIKQSIITSKKDFSLIEKKLHNAYKKNRIHFFLINPTVWEGSLCKIQNNETICLINKRKLNSPLYHISSPKLTRYEILDIIAPYLDSKAVVCNLGYPSKELFHIRHQPSNFYMLGSMGMAVPIGLGIALSSKKQVVVIDGDGSILMNPGTLATAASLFPRNLCIIAIDNGTYGSTGDQPTLTSRCVDLELVAKGFGIKDTVKVSTQKQLKNIMNKPFRGLRFIHILAVPGNREVPNISIHHLDVKKLVMGFLAKADNR